MYSFYMYFLLMQISTGNVFILDTDSVPPVFRIQIQPPGPAHGLPMQDSGLPCLTSDLLLCDCFSRDVLVLQTLS